MILIDRKSCTGCSACASICQNNCLSMAADENGFLYPQVDESACISCNLCVNVCPVLNQADVSEWSVQAYAVYSKDMPLRMDSSSGGVFSELAQAVIKQGGVVYGAAYNEQFEVEHCGVEMLDDLTRLRGAKYSQSDLKDTFSEVSVRLIQGQKVLFSGTPCQVAGLKAFLRNNCENLFCVDVVCHGVPSPLAWKEYVRCRADIDNEGVLPRRINLRSKETGWSHYRYSNVFEYDGGKMFSDINGNNLFMKLFVGDYISRESCSECQFKGYHSVSDITIGDFWGIWDIAPEMDADKGTSVVLIQSEKGKKLFSQIEDRVTVKPVSLEDASSQNPSMLMPSPQKSNRNQVLETIREGRIMELEELFSQPEKQKDSFLHKIKHRLNIR